jgi:valyl-tRNA synthetase
MNLDGYTPGPAVAQTPEDAWMLSRLARICAKSTEELETYGFGEYSRGIQSFFWNEVCDWYIELCKGRLLDGSAEERLQVQRNLVFVLDVSLRMLHPVMPFVTEKVWDALPASGLDAHDARFLMVAAWPESSELARFLNEGAEHDFELARRAISAVRSTRARYRLSPKVELSVSVSGEGEDVAALQRQIDFVRNVGRVSDLPVSTAAQKPEASISVVDGDLQIFVVVGGLVDLAAEAKRLKNEMLKAEKQLAGVVRTLANPGFVAKASAEVIAKKREQKADLDRSIERIKEQLADFLQG